MPQRHPAEAMKQLLPTSSPLEIVREPPLILEPMALVMGCVVGCAGWIVHRSCFVTWYWLLVPIFKKWTFLPWQFDCVYAFLNVNFALNQALAVGFVVGGISRWNPYRLAPTAMLLTFFLKVFHDWFDVWNTPRRPYEVSWIGWLLLLIYILVPLFGAHVGQRIQRRFVR